MAIFRVALQNYVDVELTEQDFARVGLTAETASASDIRNLLHSKLWSIVDYDSFTWREKMDI